jgi:uncharacterized protein YbjT (DUF2867 family)
LRVLVTGATGFVGRVVVDRLRADGHEPVPFSRSSGGDVRDPAALRDAMAGTEAVVNLVAILNGSAAEFEAINARGPRNVVEAAQAVGVSRIVHMSALGVSAQHAPLTSYWGSKWQGRQAVAESDREWTILEPSFVFRAGGGAFAEFERLIRLPLVPVVGDGRYRHQPVWAGDVAAAVSAALARPQTAGRAFQLGGPQVFAFDDLLDELARVTGRPTRRKLHVPARLMKLQAAILQYFPPPLRVTRDQIVMLLAGTECDVQPMREQLGIDPASMAEAYTR